MNDTIPKPAAALFERFTPAALDLVNRARDEIGLPAIGALGRPRWLSPWDNVLVEGVRQGMHGTRPRDTRPTVEATAEALRLHFFWEDSQTLELEHTPDSQSFVALLEAGVGQTCGRRRGRRGGARSQARRARARVAAASVS